jgi:hypothetical protein
VLPLYQSVSGYHLGVYSSTGRVLIPLGIIVLTFIYVFRVY